MVFSSQKGHKKWGQAPVSASIDTHNFSFITACQISKEKATSSYSF
jgi:hypothetical protein